MKKVNLQTAYDRWYYTIIGAGGDLQEWTAGYEKMLAEQEIGVPKSWFYCKGIEVNKKFNLRGKNKFKNDLVFLLFPLDELDPWKLAVFKINMQDHWFTDIIDNRR